MEAFERIWTSAGLPYDSLAHIQFEGDPVTAINSSFKLGMVAQTSIGLAGLSAAHLYELRTGIKQNVTVEARHAVLAFHDEAYYQVDGEIPKVGISDSIAGLYKTKDDSFVRIHTYFPHHRRGILSILNVPDTGDSTKNMVTEAIRQRNAVEFETETASKGMCATALRPFEVWDNHPHAQALRSVPPVSIIKIGDAPKRRLPGHSLRPLDGVRVLDLSRVLAGPTAGRTLAAHGADVLLVTSPNLPALPFLDAITSLGKRTTQLDLTNPIDHASLMKLAKDTDVFIQAYRPGGLEAKGFGTKELAALRPGIICANLTAWGWEGPFKDRRGFDSLVQTATGFNHAEAEAYRSFQTSKGEDSGPWQPRPFPVQAIDYAAGYFLSFGVNAALCKSISEGGSWEVRVSLAAVGQWVRSLGRLSATDAFGVGRPLPSRTDPEIQNLSVIWPQISDPHKTITAIQHPALLSETPVKEGDAGRAPVVLDAHDAVWLQIQQ